MYSSGTAQRPSKSQLLTMCRGGLGGEGGEGEGEGGGGEGEIHPVHSRMSWSFWVNSWRRRSSRASSCAEHPQVGAGGEAGAAKGSEDAAPTLPSAQDASSSLSRRVHLVFGVGRRCWGRGAEELG